MISIVKTVAVKSLVKNRCDNGTGGGSVHENR